MQEIHIRKIKPEDNAALAAIIRGVFDELNAPKVGTAYADPQLNDMSTVYQADKTVYFVAELNGTVVAGAGVAPLDNGPQGVCELQKMYSMPSARGKGVGKALMRACLEAAREFGFEKIYLETLPFMEDAQALYTKSGFEYLDAPLGSTGHNSCPVWMIKTL